MKKGNNIANWYNERYREKGQKSWRPFEAYKIYMNFLNISQETVLLDVACGTGYLLKHADLLGAKTFGIDISAEAVKIAKAISPNSTIIESSGENIPFPDNFFNRLTCIGALEHFENIEQGLKEFNRVTQINSKLCIVLPNSNYFFWLISKKKGTDQTVVKEKHASLQEWINIIESQGLKVIDIFQDKWYFKKQKLFSSSNPSHFLLKLLAKYFYWLVPLKYTYQFIFILKK